MNQGGTTIWLCRLFAIQKKEAIRWIAPLCYTALYFLGGSPFSAASLSARHLRSKYL